MTRGLSIALIALLLSACVSAPKPLSEDLLTRLKQGSTAVLFADDVGAISYLEDTYYVLGVSQSAANSVYKGTWDSNRDLSDLHTAEFANLGLKSQSAYSLLSASQIEEFTAAERAQARYTYYPDKKLKAAKKDAAKDPALSPAFRDALLAQGQEWLVMIAWSGFSLHIKTLGLAPAEDLHTTFWVIDLKENRVLWGAGLLTIENVSLGEKTGKEFLESDDLRGLKSEVSTRMREYYQAEKRKSKDVGTLLGLKAEPAP
jgi:hypothetical protein